MYAAIDPDEFLTALNPVTQLVDEAKLHITDDGISTTAVDPANVGMVDLNIGREAFEQLETGLEDDSETNELVLGVNLTRFTRQIKDIASEPVGDEDQTLYIDLDEETRRLSIWADPGSMEFQMALIDPDSIRQEPDLPSMELPGAATLMSSYFDHAVKTADKYSDHITIGQDADNETMFMSAEGDTDDWQAVLDEDHHAVVTLEPASVHSKFSLDYLDDMRKGMPNNVPVSFEVGDEFPIRMSFEFLDNAANAVYMVAPRIQSDE